MSDLAEFLDEHLAPEGAPTDADLYEFLDGAAVPADQHPWTVDSEGAADWAARKIQRARRTIAEKRDEHARIVAKADAWLERETSRLESEAAFFESKVGEWLHRQIEQDPKGKKSRALPCGATVKRTGGAPSLVVDDEQALVEWLTSREATAELVEFPPKVDKPGVKKLRQDDDSLAFVVEEVDEATGEVVRQVDEVKGARIERGPYQYRVDDGGAS